nr:hypothetical protein [Tanacetum cinerariifolium]
PANARFGGLLSPSCAGCWARSQPMLAEFRAQAWPGPSPARPTTSHRAAATTRSRAATGFPASRCGDAGAGARRAAPSPATAPPVGQAAARPAPWSWPAPA